VAAEQPLTINLAAWSVQVGDRTVELTYQEFRTLLYLVGRAGEVVKRSEIAAAVRTGHPGASDRMADTYIARLRKKLGAAGWDAIRTVRQIGYRYEVPEPGALHLIRPRAGTKGKMNTPFTEL
jgi:DNA-binding response OmpR family regulator